MHHARSARLVRALLVNSLIVLPPSPASGRSWTQPAVFAAQPLAVVTWPPSTGLLVSEVVTGGTAASDELIGIYNASDSTLDLGGLELVYATATGTTVTRKQTWTAQPLPSHAHLLVPN